MSYDLATVVNVLFAAAVATIVVEQIGRKGPE